MKKDCPHCQKSLKLVAESQKTTNKGITVTHKFKCPVSDCKYTYTESTVTNEDD
jgi:hypothetical protein